MSEASGRPLSVIPSQPSATPPRPILASVTPFSPSARADQAISERPQIRLALYPGPTSLPEVFDVAAADAGALLAEVGARALSSLNRMESPVPAEAALAVVENLIHARFQTATVSIMADGSLRVSDQGPGIPDKRRALLPGFTTATREMRRYIRGVGSGLPVARQLMESIGGRLVIEDNLASGTVVALLTPQAARQEGVRLTPEPGRLLGARPEQAGSLPFQPPLLAAPPGCPGLSRRQLAILRLLAEQGPAGPSRVSGQLHLSLTTAFRELTALEALGLAALGSGGKRHLTSRGEEVLHRFTAAANGRRPEG